ncbi:hypothetical protein PGR6_44230 [Pseudomonas sp. GR 6-02]|nr:hypothetical protein PGR6_44230 [Pseudomonas sp. GR 6-02]
MQGFAAAPKRQECSNFRHKKPAAADRFFAFPRIMRRF